MAHTPTPYKAHSVPEIGACHVLDKYDTVVAEVATIDDAEFIVHACNTHPAHVTAVANALRLLESENHGNSSEAQALRVLVDNERRPE
jgi:hypothetical protein